MSPNYSKLMSWATAGSICETVFLNYLWSGRSCSTICKNVIWGCQGESPAQLMGGSARGALLLEGVSHKWKDRAWIHALDVARLSPASRGRRILMRLAARAPPPPSLGLVQFYLKGVLQRRKGTKNPKNIPQNVSYENCSHFCEFFNFLIFFCFVFWGGARLVRFLGWEISLPYVPI